MTIHIFIKTNEQENIFILITSKVWPYGYQFIDKTDLIKVEIPDFLSDLLPFEIIFHNR